VLAAGTGFLHVDDDGAVEELAQPEAERTDVRMNDGACDPQGRFWAGTMAYDESPGAGVLYRLELDGSCTTVLTGLTISNGIGWSPDGATMYLADSGTGLVEAFAFEGTTGDLSERRTLVRIQRPGAVPDGLTVDQEGGDLGSAVGRRRDPALRPRRSAAGHAAPARRSTNILRLRRT
jgi:sugar lactone lactonase YvrE